MADNSSEGTWDVVDAPSAVAEEVEAHDLEHALAARARVDVLHVAELADRGALEPGFLRHLAHRRRLGRLAGPDVALRQGPRAFWLASGANRRQPPAAAQATNEDGSCRELPRHRTFVTNVDRDGCVSVLRPVRISWHSRPRSAKLCHKVC